MRTGFDLAQTRTTLFGALLRARDRFGKNLTSVHKDLISAAGLPHRVPDVGVDRALQAMGNDKKRSAKDGPAEHNFVLLEDIGYPVRNVRVSEKEARQAIGGVVE